MNPTTAVTLEVRSLIEAVCDGMADDAQVRDLESLLMADEEACSFYVYLHDFDAKLQWLVGSLQEGDAARKELAAAEQMSSQQPVPSFRSAAFYGTLGYFSEGAPLAYLLATMIVSVGLFISSRIYVSGPEQVARQSVSLPSPLSPLPSLVGRITGMVDCKWVQSPESRVQSPALDSRLSSLVSLGDTFALTSGLMEITYDTGARVILQGPVTYEVESKAGGYLSVGKLTAKLEKKAHLPSPVYGRGAGGEGVANADSPLSTLHSPLFAVRTPTATVTDLGTEFGVEVDKFGTTTSHVFRGSVRLQAASASGGIEGAGQVLRESESARVEPRSVERITMLDPSAKPNTFVRELPSQPIKLFDLVDVVAGGDGFSGKRNRGIDPTSGCRSDDPPPSKDFCLVDDGKYHRVDGMPFVDGVFVPDSRRAPVQLDSAGHTFDGVAKSSDPVTSGYIWAGGAIPIPPIVTYLRTLPIVLDGVDYTASNHGVLCLHANKGITFDLEAIRLANPAWNIVRFRAAAANLDALPERPGLADIRVFVDGRVCFQRRAVNRSNSTFSIVVPIAGNDRFLTLMGTDGEDKINWDWIVFGDPHLVLSPIPFHSEGRLPQP